MTFALMTPVIVTGSWAEKMRFSAFLVFVTLWPIFVYYPVAHWIFNPQGFLAKMGLLDFAGGIVIHTTTGKFKRIIFQTISFIFIAICYIIKIRFQLVFIYFKYVFYFDNCYYNYRCCWFYC